MIRTIAYAHPVYTPRGHGRPAPRRARSARATAPTSAAPTGAGAFTRTAWSARCAWPSASGRGCDGAAASTTGTIRHRRRRSRAREFTPPAGAGLRRPRGAAGAARRPAAGARARDCCASAAATTSASARCRSTSPSATGSRSCRAIAPRGRSGCSPSCARSGCASTRSASTTASTPAASGLQSVLAEVTNTPWGERHSYLLDGARRGRRGASRAASPRQLHVSPFMGMDHVYEARATQPGRHPVGPHREPARRRAPRSTPRWPCSAGS